MRSKKPLIVKDRSQKWKIGIALVFFTVFMWIELEIISLLREILIALK